MWSVLLFSHPRRKYLSFVLANSAPCTCFPLRLSPLRGPLPGSSIAWSFSGNSTKVTVFPKNTWTDTPLSSFPLPFVCPFLCLVTFYFIYLFFFHSFTIIIIIAIVFYFCFLRSVPIYVILLSVRIPLVS